jgi:hypothetical protein
MIPAQALRLRDSATAQIPVHKNARAVLNCYPVFFQLWLEPAASNAPVYETNFEGTNNGGFRLVWTSDIWPDFNAGASFFRRAQFRHFF